MNRFIREFRLLQRCNIEGSDMVNFEEIPRLVKGLFFYCIRNHFSNLTLAVINSMHPGSEKNSCGEKY